MKDKEEKKSKQYTIIDKTDGKVIDDSLVFYTKYEAEVWCEENAIDYDFFEIVEIRKEH